MELNIKADSSAIKRMMLAVTADLDITTKQGLCAAAQYAETLILNRTAKGTGVNGRFAPYSKGYAEAKGKGWSKSASRIGFGGDASGVVNLMVHGTMLSSMTHTCQSDRARIFFGRATEAKKAAFNHAKRPFFALNAGERDKVGLFFKRQFTK